MPLAVMDDNRDYLLLVVDANLLHAAGYAEGDASKARGILQSIIAICHRVLLSAEAFVEWNCHASRFSRTWRVGMQSRGKIRHVDLQLVHHEAMLEESGLEPSRLPNLKKDLHLVVAALEHGDRIVISHDKRAARVFSDLASAIPSYGTVEWWGLDHTIPLRASG